MEIGKAIQELRKSKGIRQAELAEQIGISKNAMCQIELGNTFPNKTTISLICSRLNIPASYLLFFSLTAEDIPEEKRQTFIYLADAIKNLLLSE